jgi:ectoine hydroxylase-related dioxygenase (phytanoyl-CoA dioxygenase family)
MDGPGFDRMAGFAPPSVGNAMHEEVVELVRAASRREDVADALVLPEGQADMAQREPEDRVSKVFKLHRRPTFASFIRSDAVVPILCETVGPDADCFLSQYIFKNAGAWGQPWHQDSYYFRFDPPRPIVGLWLAVTEATLANGCLHVLPSSHTEEIHEHVPDARPGANYGYVEIVDDYVRRPSTPVLMQPGDLLVFDSHLMHRSTDNETDGVRAAMVFHFCPAATVDHVENSPVQDRVAVLRDGVPV